MFKSRITCILVTLLLVLALATGASAAAKLVLKAPQAPGHDNLDIGTHFNVNFYLGTGTTALGTHAALLPAESGPRQNVYQINTFGAYSYLTGAVSGTNTYAVRQAVYFTQADIDEGKTIEMEIMTGRRSTNGLYDANSTYTMPAYNLITYGGVLGTFGTLTGFPEGGLKTPMFTKPTEYGRFQFSKQEDVEEFCKEIAAKSPNAYYFDLADAIDDATGLPFGKSPNYGFGMPLVIVTTTKIPAKATFEEAAKIIRESGKPTFLHQGQIHGNEPSAGEGAKAMLLEMVGEYGKKYLGKVNYVCVPRYNNEGASRNNRASSIESSLQVVDMNRDHLRLRALEVRQVHKAFLSIMPEVGMDGHELGSYSYGTSASSATRQAGTTTGNGIILSSGHDLEITPSTSLNNPSADQIDLADFYAYNAHTDARNTGFFTAHYGQTANNSIGRAWMGLMGSISVLCETRGQNIGVHMQRRAYSQLTVAKSLLETLYDDAANTKAVVAAARASAVEMGKTFDPERLVHLTQTSSNAKQTRYSVGARTFDLLGNPIGTDSRANMYTGSSRNRPRPTAYIVPKGIQSFHYPAGNLTVSAATEYRINYDYLLDSMKRNGIEFYEIAPGTTENVRKYYRSSTTNTTGSGVQADLRAAADVVFEHGAYVIPVDQVAGAVVTALFEPDVSEANAYNASVAQSDTDNNTVGLVLITHAISPSLEYAARDYPYYRLEQDNPREVLPVPYAEAEAFVKKLIGNKNELNIVVFEYYGNGELKDVFEKTFSIDNNAADYYIVGPYKVYVDTKGNVQIRDCKIVENVSPKKLSLVKF